MKLNYPLLKFFIVAIFFLPNSAHAGDRELVVVASIPPLAEFAEQVGGSGVNVHVMVPPGANPHIYEPTPEQLRLLDNAKLYIEAGSGIEFEIAWLDKLKNINRNVLFCDSSEGVPLSRSGHHHDKVAMHNAHGNDPHVWLSPKNAMQMVRNIEKAFIEVDPANQSIYAENAEKFIEELKQLDLEVRSDLSGFRGRSFLVYHPAWSYFAREYGLVEISIEADGKEPSAKQLIETVQNGKAQKIRAVFVSPQFSQKSSRMVAEELKAELILADDLSKNYVENIRTISEKLKRVLSDNG